MKIITIALSFLLLILLVGCNSGAFEDTSYDNDKIDRGISDRNSEFAFDIFKELNYEDKDENIFISPLSISTALSMTYQGARGTTKEKMAEALNYDDIDVNNLNDSYENLLKYLNNVDENIKLDINNSIWFRSGEKINEDFLNTNKNIFDAYIKDLDFSKDKSVDVINKWIDESTNGKIKKMINPPISPDTIMYLINAIYFKGEWSEKFDTKYTTESKFYTEDGLEKDIFLMSRKDGIEYGEGQDYKAVRLPYGNKKTSMYLILPDKKMSINDFINDVNLKKWKSIKESISEEDDVMLKIPKFKMEYGIKELKKSLSNLGMKEAFTESADFSGIGDDILISSVKHKAVIEVNEKGSEAAGVTVVEMNKTSMPLDPIEFIANRPFMFIIADDVHDSILFMGKYYDVE